MKLPVLFISHGGGPCFWIDWGPVNPFARLAYFFENLASEIKIKPKQILIVSAHWEEKEFTILSNAKPTMLYDYSGFPESTYQLQYPAPGSVELAKRVQELLRTNGLVVHENTTRGYDHGVFVPLMKIYPKADIPIAQISLKKNLNPLDHIALGKALEPLRSEGVLIIGSGLTYHNLRHIPETGNASGQFDPWLFHTVCELDAESRNRELCNWEKAPAARQCHPREDHLIPLMVAAGAAGADQGHRNFSEKMLAWNFWTSCYRFG